MWTFEQMRRFAAGGRPEVRARTKRRERRNRGRYKVKPSFYSAVDYEAMILTPGYTGLRLGEVLALLESGFDGVSLEVAASGHEGELVGSSEEKNHERIVPSPPTLAKLIRRRVEKPASEYLLSTPREGSSASATSTATSGCPPSWRRVSTPRPTSSATPTSPN